MPPWNNLPKAADDNTTIDEEIDAKLATHNADPEAHTETDASLEAHRTNPVVDHPAESVVNDKLQVLARRYAAIVDPDDEEAFDTISSAMDYVRDLGGGVILIARGTHIISDVIEIWETISLYGFGIDETIIEFDDATPGQLVYDYSPTGGANQDIKPNCEGLTFDFSQIANAIDYSYVTFTGIYNQCKFTDGDESFYSGYGGTTMRDCVIDCYHARRTIFLEDIGYFQACRFDANANGSEAGTFTEGTVFDDCKFRAAGYTGHDWIDNVAGASFSGCLLQSLSASSITGGNSTGFWGQFRWINNRIEMVSSNALTLSCDKLIFMGNRVTGSTSNLSLPSGSDYNIVVGNILNGSVTNSGTGNQVANNVTGQA